MTAAIKIPDIKPPTHLGFEGDAGPLCGADAIPVGLQDPGSFCAPCVIEYGRQAMAAIGTWREAAAADRKAGVRTTARDLLADSSDLADIEAALGLSLTDGATITAPDGSKWVVSSPRSASSPIPSTVDGWAVGPLKLSLHSSINLARGVAATDDITFRIAGVALTWVAERLADPDVQKALTEGCDRAHLAPDGTTTNASFEPGWDALIAAVVAP